MEQSPLTHQPRPEVFQPKIVQLYDELLGHPDDIPDEGFWSEFFLLRPDHRALRQRIDALTAGDLLALEVQTRQLFSHAVNILYTVKAPAGAHGHPDRTSSVSVRPESAIATVENTLATLTTFLSAALAKRYNNPSADVIDLLAGLDRVDAVLSDFVAALDQILRWGTTETMRTRAVEVILAVTAGAYQTTVLTYFIQRDLFQAIMKIILNSPAAVAPAFTLIGLLANYNKFEFQNPYQLRLGDFVNEETIQKTLWGVGDACQVLREQYIDIQDRKSVV